MNKLKNIKAKNKLHFIIFSFILIVAFIVAYPTLCKILMKSNEDTTYWNGQIATSFKEGNGTSSNPYIISTPEEFALLTQFDTQTESYYEITNDLYLNEGVFEYKDGNIIYIKDSTKYYIKPNTNEYYTDTSFSTKVGTVNIFPTIDNLMGYIDGKNNHIYGLYITSNNEANLINNFTLGELKNIRFENSYIGGQNSSSLIGNLENSSVENLVFVGTINTSLTTKNYSNTENAFFFPLYEEHNLPYPGIEEGSKVLSTKLTGVYHDPNEGDADDDFLLKVNGEEFGTSEFEITNFDIKEPVIFEFQTDMAYERGYGPITEVEITDLTLEITYQKGTSSLIKNSTNGIISNVLTKGNIIGGTISNGILYQGDSVALNNVENEAEIRSECSSSGIVGITDSTSYNTVLNKANISTNENNTCLFSFDDTNSISSGITILSTNDVIEKALNLGTVNSGDIEVEHSGYSANATYTNSYYELNKTAFGNLSNDAYENLSATEPKVIRSNDFISAFFNDNTTWKITQKSADLYEPSLIINDTTLPNVTIKINNETYQSLINEKNKKYIFDNKTFEVTYSDTDSAILKVEYFLEKQNNTQALNPSSINWNLYKENYTINTPGYYTYYLKVTDSFGNISYASTDLFIYDGYNVQILDGENNTSLSTYNNQITQTSKIKYTFQKEIEATSSVYNTESYYKLHLSNALPVGTIIKLFDKENSTTYYYEVQTELTDILLSEFMEIGSSNETKFNKKPSDYYNGSKQKENFEVIFDFLNTNIESNISYEVELQIIDNNNVISSSLGNNKKFTLVKYNQDNVEIKSNLNLESNFSGYINLSQEGSNNINLTNEIGFGSLNAINVYDTNLQNKNIYLTLKIVDLENKIINTDVINGIKFILDDTTYYATNNGIVNIPWSTSKTSETKTLNVNVEHVSSSIQNGTYYLKINTYCSDCSSNIESNIVTIPVNINNQESNAEFNFDVSIDINDRYFDKNLNSTLNNRTNIPIKIDYTGTLNNPKVVVSLYKKQNFSAYNQTYELVDLGTHISTNLESLPNYKYELINNLTSSTTNKELNFKINIFSFGGYKLVFDLYDGNTYTGSVSKTIVVK